MFDRVDIDDLVVPSWNATHILRPDLLALSASLAEHGLLNPIIVRSSTMQIIDGSQRVMLMRGNSNLRKIFPEVDVRFMDISEVEAMALHVQINRGRGSIVAKKLSEIVRTLKRSRVFGPQDFQRMWSMRGDELELMLDGTILKSRKVKNHQYSRAWVPVEAPAGTVDSGQGIVEAPPGPDR